ncbi:hypothetical protein KJK34_12235 [Flavobacterium sp. D11R37]|uniref:hypothetical protein n=1 Tax=Flavobacterium coralii TaxID=2838017 RepID=UPI001CA63F03|nr:hypothetical protein [Flavobacterium coralii]MBY8963523.1 hypothetical protein [Flavobacterium coralii]
MENSELFKYLALFSPLVSGIVVGLIMNKLSNRSKRLEYFYQHKIPAFKELHQILIRYKIHLDKVISEGYNIDNYPHTGKVESTDSLETAVLLKESLDTNRVYLNKKSRDSLTKLIDELYDIYNIESLMSFDEDTSNPAFKEMSNKIENITEILYKDLNLR